MKYLVSRTSTSFLNEHPPVVEAQKVMSYLRKDIRTFKSKKEWLDRFPHDDGENVIEWGKHKEGFYRIFKTKEGVFEWVVEIPDLIEFSKKYGKILLTTENYLLREWVDKPDDVVAYVEIYDDYRE